MAALEKQDFITSKAYLEAENDRPEGIRYEYINGYVYAMAGASRNHNLLTGNLFLSLGSHLRGTNCQVFQSDMKVGIKTNDEQHYYYPDVQVTCSEESDTYYNKAPCLIIEVLSESTARTDRHEKFLAYRKLASLQEYVLCSQNFPAIEVYRRSNDWKVERYSAGQTVKFESVDLEISMDELYDFLINGTE